MKSISTSTLGKILKWALVFVFALGLFLTPFCHWLLHLFYKQIFNMDLLPLAASLRTGADITHLSGEYTFMVAEIYTLGIVMLGIVWQLIRICHAIETNCPFTEVTHSSLKNMAFFSLALVVIYVIKFAVFPALPGLLVAFAFVIVGMISSVFSQLFKKAVEFKEENDFTI